MLASVFDSKLKKCNKYLRIDRNRIAYPYSKDYPTCGLYDGTKFIMGVPHIWVPEYSISCVNFTKLIHFNKFDAIKHIEKYGEIPDGEDISERILWKGYRAILAELVRRKKINKAKAEKVFNISIEPGRVFFPRHIIHMEF